MFSGTADRLREFFLAVGQLGADQEFGHPQNAVHGRADFVAHVGEKSGFCHAGFLGAFLGRHEFGCPRGDLLFQALAVLLTLHHAGMHFSKHVVESVHQGAEFVVAALHGPHGVVVGGLRPFSWCRSSSPGDGPRQTGASRRRHRPRRARPRQWPEWSERRPRGDVPSSRCSFTRCRVPIGSFSSRIGYRKCL